MWANNYTIDINHFNMNSSSSRTICLSFRIKKTITKNNSIVVWVSFKKPNCNNRKNNRKKIKKEETNIICNMIIIDI